MLFRSSKPERCSSFAAADPKSILLQPIIVLMFWPDAPSFLAICSPIPLFPPVTSATFWFKLIFGDRVSKLEVGEKAAMRVVIRKSDFMPLLKIAKCELSEECFFNDSDLGPWTHTIAKHSTPAAPLCTDQPSEV